MKKLWLIILLVGAGASAYLYSQKHSPAGDRVSQNLIQKQSPEGLVQEPKNFSIPKLGINTDIEQVGMDKSGRMEVPNSAYTVGWWKLGARPGEVGSAVVAGHLDTPQGTSGVFYSLNDLKVGDKIVVTDINDKKYTFEVLNKQTYKDATFPIQKVFASNDGIYLNLITCWGTWDKKQKNYDERLVVFSKLKI